MIHRPSPCPPLTARRLQDCFYASVFERETPALKALPLAVQQKQIVVTCNYEARRRVGRHRCLHMRRPTDCPRACTSCSSSPTPSKYALMSSSSSVRI